MGAVLESVTVLPFLLQAGPVGVGFHQPMAVPCSVSEPRGWPGSSPEPHLLLLLFSKDF